jgi:hypothetical protein
MQQKAMANKNLFLLTPSRNQTPKPLWYGANRTSRPRTPLSSYIHVHKRKEKIGNKQEGKK